jgi:hypothetical protein
MSMDAGRSKAAAVLIAVMALASAASTPEQPQLFSGELRAAFRSLRGNAATTAGSH